MVVRQLRVAAHAVQDYFISSKDGIDTNVFCPSGRHGYLTINLPSKKQDS